MISCPSSEIWAPTGAGNDPVTYRRNLRAGSGYDPDAQLDFNDPTVLRNLINGFTTAENSRIFPQEQVDAAIAVAREHHRRRAEERRSREEERRLREQERRRQ